MNMTSDEKLPEAPAPEDSTTKFNAMKRQQQLAKMLENPEYVRRLKNWQRAQEEYRKLMEMTPEQRSRYLFSAQCYCIAAWRDATEKARKQRARKEREVA